MINEKELNNLGTRPKAKAAVIPLEQLHPFENHPYKVQDNDDMQALTDSIKESGIFSPLIVRPLDDGSYEIISGHRRSHAAEEAGLKTVPALIYALDKASAAIAVVDSNLHRENILPSEKAFAYKLKLEAIRHQGMTSTQVAWKSETADVIGENDKISGDTVRRYIRLTKLIPEILQLVDDKKIAFSPAVELSYLAEQEQYDLLETIESEDCTPSLSQAQRMKKIIC